MTDRTLKPGTTSVAPTDRDGAILRRLADKVTIYRAFHDRPPPVEILTHEEMVLMSQLKLVRFVFGSTTEKSG